MRRPTKPPPAKKILSNGNVVIGNYVGNSCESMNYMNIVGDGHPDSNKFALAVQALFLNPIPETDIKHMRDRNCLQLGGFMFDLDLLVKAMNARRKAVKALKPPNETVKWNDPMAAALMRSVTFSTPPQRQAGILNAPPPDPLSEVKAEATKLQ